MQKSILTSCNQAIVMASSIRIPRSSVKASYYWFKFAQILHTHPLKFDLQRGTLSYKSSNVSNVAYKILYAFICLKGVHLAYALARGISLLEESNFASTIFTAIISSLYFTGMQWNRQLYQGAVDETIIMFNTFGFPDSTTRSLKRGLRGKITWAFKVLMSVDSADELLLLLCPFIVSVFVPLVMILSLVYPSWDVTLASLLPPEKLHTFTHAIILLYELCTYLFLQCTLIFAFFLELSVASVHFPAMLLTCLENVEQLER